MLNTQERPRKGLYSNHPGLAGLNSSALDHQARYVYAAAEMAALQIRRIMDAGCGGGESTRFLDYQMTAFGKRPRSLVGVDKDLDSIILARTTYSEPLRFHQADITHPEFFSQLAEQDIRQIDGAVFLEVIEHLPPELVQQTLHNLHSLLNPEWGTLVVSTPNRVLTANRKNHPFNPFHTQEYNQEEFLAELRQANFTVEGLLGQRVLPNEALPYIVQMQRLANKLARFSKMRSLLAKTIALSIMVKAPNATVKKYNPATHTPKYMVATCRVRND